MDTQDLLMGCNTATLKAHKTALLAEAAVVDEILKGRVKPNNGSATMVGTVKRVNGTDAAPKVNVPACLSIASLAHHIWLGRGSPIGSDQEDWFRAEQELRNNPGSFPTTG